MARVEDERTMAHSISRRCINHSLAEKLWNSGLAFASMTSRCFEKNRSSSPKALIVMAPEMASARLLATADFVVPEIRISSLAETE